MEKTENHKKSGKQEDFLRKEGWKWNMTECFLFSLLTPRAPCLAVWLDRPRVSLGSVRTPVDAELQLAVTQIEGKASAGDRGHCGACTPRGSQRGQSGPAPLDSRHHAF